MADKPAFNAYTVIKKDGADDFWQKVGAAWAHGKGGGYNVVLQSIPLDGKIVLLPPKDDDDAPKKEDKSKYKK